MIIPTCTSRSAISRAAADGGLSRKLCARRRHNRDQRAKSSLRPAARRRRREALAVAAHKCSALPAGRNEGALGFGHPRPATLPERPRRVAKQGVWLAKAGFGAFKTAYELPPVAAARAHGMITTVHTGGSSIPGRRDHRRPPVALRSTSRFHVNGGRRRCRQGSSASSWRAIIALQCARPAIYAPRCCALRCTKHKAFDPPHHCNRHATGSGRHADRHAIHHLPLAGPRGIEPRTAASPPPTEATRGSMAWTAGF